MDRVSFHDQELFLSGSNVAWIEFARDIGPGPTHLDQFDQMFRELRAQGGNSMRLWLHTTGASTPEWNGHDVIGPGVGAIADLRDILDVAHRNNVSLILCLWSFDMLRISNGTTVTDRAFAILADPAKRQLYIDNALIPMVAALKEHPAILAWEIFNEAEGMSEEFGWSFNRHVPMSAIQAFVGHAAAAIKETDRSAKVTTGAWSFLVLTDILTDRNAQNYYRDDRLMAASGERNGRLDFYTVHYYTWAGTRLSPFHHDAAHWQLDKPVVVAEFYAKDDMFGVSREALYETLHHRGYAGALGWQWVDHVQNRDNNFESWPNILMNMQRMAALRPDDVPFTYPRIPKHALRHHWLLDDPPAWTDHRAPLLDSAAAVSGAAVLAAAGEANPPRFREPGAAPGTGSSVYFGGSESRAELGHVAPGPGPFTISFWFKLNRISSQSHLLSTAATEPLPGSWSLHLDGPPRNLAAGQPTLLFAQEEGPNVVVASDIASGRWYHLALTRNSETRDNFSIFLDGSRVHRGTNHLDFVNSSDGVFLAQKPSWPLANGFDGWIDDVRFYDAAIEHIGMLWGDGYTLWARNAFGDRFEVLGTRAEDDFNHDSVTNFERYLAGEDPNVTRAKPALVSGIRMNSAADPKPVEIEFSLPLDPSLDFSLESAADLIEWNAHRFGFDGTDWSFADPASGSLEEISRTGNLARLRARFSFDHNETETRFFRLNIPFPQ